MRRRVRGSSSLLRLTAAVGLMDRPVRYALGGGLHIDVPIFRPDNLWDQSDIAAYEEQAIAVFASEARRLPSPVTYIDCGADIGLFALRLASLLKLSHVVAIEPDGGAFPWLQANLVQLNGKAMKCAAASFTGKGRLEFPDYYPDHPHAQYLVPDCNGPVNVIRIDDIETVPGSLAIKIDVEGGELDVLNGASQTIRRSLGTVIVFEAHPQVIGRTGVNPVECLRVLAGIRPFRFFVAETGEPLSIDRDVEMQGIINIIASSVEPS